MYGGCRTRASIARLLNSGFLERLAQRFCRSRPTTETITVQSVISRIQPHNVNLSKGRAQFWMELQCVKEQAVLCRTFLQSRTPQRSGGHSKEKGHARVE